MLTGEKILLSNQRQIVEQAKFTYFSFGKAFEKQTKTIEGQVKKQAQALEVFKPNIQNQQLKMAFQKTN